MKEISRIQFKFSQKPFVEFWNETQQLQIQYGIIGIDRNSIDYQQLSHAFHQFYLGEQSWKELIEVEYEAKDLAESVLLSLWISGSVGIGGNHFGTVYEVSEPCPQCGQSTIVSQLQNSIVETKGLSHGDTTTLYDLNRTDFDDEIIVSDKLRNLLESLGVKGIGFRPISNLHAGQISKIDSWYQLTIQGRTGNFASQTHLFDQGVCQVCGNQRFVQFDIPKGYLVSRESEPYFYQFEHDRYAFLLSSQKLKSKSTNVGQSCIIVSRDLYLAMKSEEITGFWAQPAYQI